MAFPVLLDEQEISIIKKAALNAPPQVTSETQG